MNGFFTKTVLAHREQNTAKQWPKRRWEFLIQNVIIVIPTTTRPERMAENVSVFHSRSSKPTA